MKSGDGPGAVNGLPFLKLRSKQFAEICTMNKPQKNTKDPQSVASDHRAKIIYELSELKEKTDPLSIERYEFLIEQLMVVDMALKPTKDAMKKAAGKKEQKN